MRSAILTLALLGVILGGRSALGADELIEKACKAYGNADAISKAKTLAWTGVLKGYGGGGHISKYDIRVQVRFPSDIRRELEGTEGTFGKQGSLVINREGWQFQREAFRRLAPDEVDEIVLDIRDLDWLGRLRRGEQKFERLPDQKFGDVDCAGLKLLGDPRREVNLWFDKSTGLLHRRDEATKGREGDLGREYTIFEDYQEFEGFKGFQVASTRTTFVNQKIQDTETEKYELANKVVVDELTLDAQIPAEVFQAPQDPFAVQGLSGDEAKKRADALLEYFKGRRDPDLAAWAAVALARMKADAAVQSLVDQSGELKYYGCAARVRMGAGKDVPEDFRASEWRKKTAASQGFGEAPAKVTVQFVGSAGFALKMGGAAVFIDAFYQPGLFGVAAPAIDPASVAKADVVLFTHAGQSHFCPWVAAEMLGRTHAKAFGPPSVIALLRERGVADSQLQAVSPEPEKPVKITAGAVELVAFAVGPIGQYTKEGKPEHVAWMVTAGGAKVVHVGVAGEFKDLDEDAVKEADLMLLPYWMLTNKNAEFIKKSKARYLVPMLALDNPGAYGSLKNHRQQFPRVVPMMPGEEAEF